MINNTCDKEFSSISVHISMSIKRQAEHILWAATSENKCFEHVHNAQIQIIVRMRKLSYGSLLSIQTLCSIQLFC